MPNMENYVSMPDFNVNFILQKSRKDVFFDLYYFTRMVCTETQCETLTPFFLQMPPFSWYRKQYTEGLTESYLNIIILVYFMTC